MAITYTYMESGENQNIASILKTGFDEIVRVVDNGN